MAAVLPDGRVLVAGGYYLSGETSRIDTGAETVLAAYRSTPASVPMPPGAILADVDPVTLIAALATAELYDPATDDWSPTGPMRYARYGSEATTLADGRVLVVGSWSGYHPGWNHSYVTVDERVYESRPRSTTHAPAASLTESLPPSTRSSLSLTGLSGFSDEVRSRGTLVALADGGALLVGRTSRWDAWPEGNTGTLVRTLRFDPGSGRWTEIDRSLDRRDSAAQADRPGHPGTCEPQRRRGDARRWAGPRGRWRA